jgi:hypothetical protein
MAPASPDGIPSFVRQRMLGSDAVYEVLDDGEPLVTCEVVRAPGLRPGTRVRLLPGAVRAMAQLDASEMTPTRRSAPGSFAGVAARNS